MALSLHDGLITRVVTMASTVHGMMPASSVQRYSQAEKKAVSVSRPCLFTAYNKGMGGTDRMDENISIYRIGIREKNWWWPIFTWLLDTAIHNAWILAEGAGSNIQNLNSGDRLLRPICWGMARCPKAQDVHQLQRPAHSVTVVCQMISALVAETTWLLLQLKENGEDVQGKTVCLMCVLSVRSVELDCVFRVSCHSIPSKHSEWHKTQNTQYNLSFIIQIWFQYCIVFPALIFISLYSIVL